MQGSGGGPSEDDISGSVLRSIAVGWKPNALLAVDAGTHLSGIISILENHHSTDPTSSTCPFHGADIPFTTPRAKAAYILRELLSTFLVTHSHLDHISGLAIASAALKNMKRRKRIAALPHTITAIRKHIFNDIIWPNLSDEDDGVGLVTYMRLPEGEPEYVSVAEGLRVQAWSVSHGHCMKKHSHKGSTAGLRGSSAGLTTRVPTPSLCDSPSEPCVYDSTSYFIQDEASGAEVLMWGDVEPDSISLSPRNLVVWNEAAKKIQDGKLRGVFIECSFDNCQPDEFLFGHLSPKHLYDELTYLARQVILLREGIAEDEQLQQEDGGTEDMDMEWRLSDRKRKRASLGGWNEDPEITQRRWGNPHKPGFPSRRILEEEGEEPSGGVIATTVAGDDVVGRNVDGDVSPRCTASDPEDTPPTISLSQFEEAKFEAPSTPKNGESAVSREVEMNNNSPVNGRKADKDKERRILNRLSSYPLGGLLVVVNHVKDTLEDGVDTRADVYQRLQALEAENKLGVTFVMAAKGQTIFF